MNTSERKHALRITIIRHIIQICAVLLFCLPLIVTSWALFGGYSGVEDVIQTPAETVFFGSLSSTTIFGLTMLDGFAYLQVIAASKTFLLSSLIAILPPLIFYTFIRGRAFCGWICPLNLFLECIDWVRRKFNIKVSESKLPRFTKIYIALGIIVLSAFVGIPLFESFSPISALHKFILFGSLSGILILVAVVILELFWGHRVWCRSLCPLGGFYEVIGSVGQINVRIDHEKCVQCDSCKRSCLCDSSILDSCIHGDDLIVRSGDCMICGACVDACPQDALRFSVGRPKNK